MTETRREAVIAAGDRTPGTPAPGDTTPEGPSADTAPGDAAPGDAAPGDAAPAPQRTAPELERAATAGDRLGPWALDTVHNVDCARGLAALPDGCIDVIVTSPPYWGQRGAGGLGSEADPRDYVAHLTAVLAEAMRCLSPAGTLWLNLGDAYNTPINWRATDHVYSSLGAAGAGLPASNSAYTKNRGRRRAFVRGDVPWLRYGNLLAIPYRVVIAMCDRGFLFRGEVIWTKTKPMPEGLCRRPHRRHEGIYVFARSERHAFQTRPPVGSVWALRQTPNLTPHCSTFPLDLPVWCIRAAGVAANAVVCDPFMGSGTTGRAAHTLGHRFLGFELDPAMCQLANDHARGGGPANPR